VVTGSFGIIGTRSRLSLVGSYRSILAKLTKAIGLLGVVLVTLTPAGAQTIEMAYPEEDAVGQGPGHFAFNFLRAAEMIVNDSGLSVTWTPMPVARLIHTVKTGKANFCVGGAGINAERAAFGQFSLPFMNDRWIGVIGLKSRRKPLEEARNFEELAAQRGLRFLGIQGSNYGAQIAPQLAELQDRIGFIPRSTEQLLDMLQRGRADYGLVMKTYMENYLAARPERDDFVVVGYPDLRRDYPTAFMCSRVLPAGTIDALNAAIARQLPKIRAAFPEQRLDIN